MTRQELSTLWLSKLLDNDTLFVDNSRLELFTTCPRQAQYGVIDKYVLAGEKAALSLGECMHLVLKMRYLLKAAHQDGVNEHHVLNYSEQEMELRQMWLIDEFFKLKPVADTEYRNQGFAQAVTREYNDFWTQEPFEILKTKTGMPLVEEPFAVYLGTINGIKIIWTGRMDIGVEQEGIYVFDHKTSSMGGDYFFQEFYNSSQMLGYCFALQNIYQKEVKGAIINALFCRKPTKTGKGTEFARLKIPYDQERILEWQFDTLSVVENFLHQVEQGHLPMHTKWCINKYGRCQYFDVCTLDAGSRHKMLTQTGAYIPDPWTPLRPDPLDVRKFLTEPVPEEIIHAVPKAASVNTSFDLGDYLA